MPFGITCRIQVNLIPPRTYFKIIQYEYILQVVLILLIFVGFIPMIINPIIMQIYNFLIKLGGF